MFEIIFHNGSILNDKKYIANAFNAYFVNIGPTLASKIPDLGMNHRNFMPQQNNMSFFLSPVDDSEVKKHIAQLKDGDLNLAHFWQYPPLQTHHQRGSFQPRQRWNNV